MHTVCLLHPTILISILSRASHAELVAISIILTENIVDHAAAIKALSGLCIEIGNETPITKLLLPNNDLRRHNGHSSFPCSMYNSFIIIETN